MENTLETLFMLEAWLVAVMHVAHHYLDAFFPSGAFASVFNHFVDRKLLSLLRLP